MLKLIPKSNPPPKERVVQRIKRMARPDGVLMCERCGGRTLMTATQGVRIIKGYKTGGTVVEKDVCADCYKRGIFSSMLPELKRVK